MIPASKSPYFVEKAIISPGRTDTEFCYQSRYGRYVQYPMGGAIGGPGGGHGPSNNLVGALGGIMYLAPNILHWNLKF